MEHLNPVDRYTCLVHSNVGVLAFIIHTFTLALSQSSPQMLSHIHAYSGRLCY